MSQIVKGFYKESEIVYRILLGSQIVAETISGYCLKDF